MQQRNPRGRRISSERPRASRFPSQRCEPQPRAQEVSAEVPAGWDGASATSLNTESLLRLMNNEIPLVRIPDFATSQECEALAAEAGKRVFDAYRGVEPRINRVGNTVFEYDGISSERYFQERDSAWARLQQMFAASFDPLERMMNLFRARTGYRVRIASEQGIGSYYAGLVRRIERGTLLHIDYAPAEQPGWEEPSSVEFQLSWNLYLRLSGERGGRTHIFNRQWRPADDVHKTGSYGYDRCVVERCEEVSFQPSVGEVVLFNTRNFHCVSETDGERVAFTTALGKLPNDEFIFWS